MTNKNLTYKGSNGSLTINTSLDFQIDTHFDYTTLKNYHSVLNNQGTLTSINISEGIEINHKANPTNIGSMHTTALIVNGSYNNDPNSIGTIHSINNYGTINAITAVPIIHNGKGSKIDSFINYGTINSSPTAGIDWAGAAIRNEQGTIGYIENKGYIKNIYGDDRTSTSMSAIIENSGRIETIVNSGIIETEITLYSANGYGGSGLGEVINTSTGKVYAGREDNCAGYEFIRNQTGANISLIQNDGFMELKNLAFISTNAPLKQFINNGTINFILNSKFEESITNDALFSIYSTTEDKTNLIANTGTISVNNKDYKPVDGFSIFSLSEVESFVNGVNGVIELDYGAALYANNVDSITNEGVLHTKEGSAVSVKNIGELVNTGTIKTDNGYAITVAAGANIDNQGVLQGSIVALHLHGDGSSSTTPFTTEFSNTGELKFSADKNTGEGAHLGIASYGTLNVNKYKLSITQSAEDFNNANNNNYNIDNNKLNDLDNTDKQSHIIVLGPDAAGGHPDAGWSSINFKEGSVFLDMDSMIKQESSFRLNTVYDSNSLVLANQKDNTTNNFGKLEAVGGEVNNGKGIGSVDFIYLDNNIYKAEYIKGDNAASADLESDYNAKFKITADTLNSKSYVAAQASTLSHIRRNYMIANVIDEEIKNFNQDYKSFIKTYYVDDNYDLANNNGSLKGDGYGLILGLNKRITEDKILGFYMGYEDLSLDNTMNRLNIKDKAFYGGVNYYLSLMQGEDGDLFAKTQARLSYTDSKMQRTLISSQDNSNYDTLSYGVAFSLGYEKKINNFILTPKMSLAYDRLNIDSFTLGNERYSKNNINLYTLSPALEARYDFNDKMYIAANLGVNINLDDTYNSDFMIENIRYSDSYVLDDFYYFNKIDLGLRLSNNTDIALGYNGIYSNRLTSHSAMFNMRWWF
ncbi:autotransporter outer membrane beta-barrel domain-containing protein [Campylobacter jejuni]|nr:autotransporter outer membrane beta-barrel domain-containing protein [Campylobacter jejuni]